MSSLPPGDYPALLEEIKGLKKGLSTTHPLHTEELRLIKAWMIERARMKPPCSAFFVSQKRQSLNPRNAWLIVQKYGERAALALPAHPHHLRHVCGFALADQGADTRLIQDYLGHRDIRHAVIYTLIRRGLKNFGVNLHLYRLRITNILCALGCKKKGIVRYPLRRAYNL